MLKNGKQFIQVILLFIAKSFKICNVKTIKNSIYVGDTIGDKTAADFAGIPFGFASYGFGEVTEYDYKLNDIADLLTIVYDKQKGGNDFAER